MNLSLENVSQGVGHVLVHHLFTGTYQSLKPKGESRYERLANEFFTSVQAYAFARAYDLQSLEELAKSEVEKLSAELPVAMVLNLVQDAYPNLSVDDMWISGYIKSRLKSFTENRAEQLERCHISNDKRKTVSVKEIVLYGLLELFRETEVIHRADLSPASVPAEVSGNILPTLPESKFKVSEHIEGGLDERKLVNTDQLSCDMDTVGVIEAILGLVPSRKPNAKDRRKARRELRRRNAEAPAELDLKANKPERKEFGEANGSSCKFEPEEDLEKVIEEEWIYTGSTARNSE